MGLPEGIPQGKGKHGGESGPRKVPPEAASDVRLEEEGQEG